MITASLDREEGDIQYFQHHGGEVRPGRVRGRDPGFLGAIAWKLPLYLREDGSGKADDGSNDITVTSDMGANVGDVITVTGFVTLNKDLGSGYKYPVIIERASIQRAVDADR